MSKPIKQSRQDSRLILEELEQRRLFSAGAEGLIDPVDEPDADPLYLDLDAREAQAEAGGEDAAAAEQQSQEVVFIDTGVEDYQLLVDDIRANMDSGRDLEVVVLDRDRDGIEQISEYLREYSDLDAVHIISHGSDGSVELGNTSLDAASLEQNKLNIALWANAFSDIGDILIYGCDLAATETGRGLIDDLGALTLTDVAASDDLTGAGSQGGDWLLEYRAGTIDSQLAVSAELQQEYQHTLATYTVTTLADSGAGSLRQAIDDANANGGADTIEFAVAGTISLTSGLPAISDTVSIDATTAPGYAGEPLVILDGTSAGSTDGLSFNGAADGSSVAGLAVVNFNGDGIQVGNSVSDMTITGNWIGTTGNGTSGDGNSGHGINVDGNNNLIGGTGANDGNVIANNGIDGINVDGTGTIIQGNIIGLDPDGVGAAGNVNSGIRIEAGGGGTTIGGTSVAERNIISANGDDGILIGSDGNIVQGNYIGTDITGTLNRGNVDDGVDIQNNGSNNQVGGAAPGAGNLIAYNGDDGIDIDNGTGNAFLGNRVFGNGDQDILVAPAANNGQAAPVLAVAEINTVGQIDITGSLSSTPDSFYRVEFFGHNGAFLGFTNVATDGAGNANFVATLGVDVDSGTAITATATASDAAYATFTDTSTRSSSVSTVRLAPYAFDDPGDFSTEVQNLNPQGYWRLGDGAGGATDLGSAANTGTYVGASLGQSGAITGDTAAYFDGSSYVEITHDDAYLVDEGTIQAWFNVDDPTVGDLQHIFSKDGSGFLTGGHVSMVINTAGQLEVRLQDTGASYTVTSTASVSAGTWHHAAFSFGADGMRLYLDGVLVDSDIYSGGLGTSSGGSGNLEDIAIGAGTRNSASPDVTPVTQLFTGSIDEVALFGTQLDSLTIAQLAHSLANNYDVGENATLGVAAASGVLANDFDEQGDPLTVLEVNGSAAAVGSQITLASGALLTLNADGSLDYDPNGQFESLGIGDTATDSFTYTLGDGTGHTDSATVTVTVNGANDAPTITSGASANVAENTTAVTTVTATDVDGDTPGFSISGGTDQAFFTIDPVSGALSFSTAPDHDAPADSGADNTYQVEVTAADGNGGFDTQTITVTVTNTNDSVTALDDGYTVGEDAVLTSSSGWFDTDWQYRRTLSFDNSARTENLVDFPVLVTLDSNVIDYSKTHDQGDDLRFFDQDGTALSHEIELWDESGTSYVWVKIPQIDANSDTDSIVMYYGNAAVAGDGQDPAGVWSAYVAAYHLNEDPGAGGTLTDSGGSYDATNVGSTDAGGYIAGGQDFDGVDDYIDLGPDRPWINNASGASLSLWINADTTSGNNDLIGVSRWEADGDSSASRITLVRQGDEIRLIGRSLDDNSDVVTVTTSTAPLGAGQWHHVTGTIDYNSDVGNINIYVDGVLQGTFSHDFVGPVEGSNSSDAAIGSNEGGVGGHYDGQIDEARITDRELSADWISAQYAAMTGNLVNVGYEQTVAGVLANDIDAEGNVLTVAEVNGDGAAVGTPTVLPSGAIVTLNGDGSFTYDTNGVFGWLKTGESTTDSFTYSVADGNGDWDAATVTVTIDGADDVPVIGGTDSGSVTEDAGVVGGFISAAGGLTISDDDAGESSFQVATVNGTYGDLTIDAAGNWSYSADNSQVAIQSLDTGQSLLDTLTVTTFDGTTHDIFVTINGTEDAAVIGGVSTGTVNEDFGIPATGTLTITDIDTGDNPSFPDVGTTAGDNSYGSFEMTAGTWTYTLDDSNLTVQALDKGETLTDTFTFTASDGSTQVVTVTIEGTNETVAFTVTGAASAYEGETYTLNFSADQPMDSWTIDWGDGNVETIAGDPGSATHVYANADFTSNILVSATNATGTFTAQNVMVASYVGGNNLHIYGADTGISLLAFGDADGLQDPGHSVFGPDGNIYVSGEGSDNVLRYDINGNFLGEFVAAGSGGLDLPLGLDFGPDGNLYVADYGNNQVLRYDGTTGAFIGVFATDVSLNGPNGLLFGPDGNLYVNGWDSDNILRFDGNTGAFIDEFVGAGSGGLDLPEQMAFGPDGNLYVGSTGTDSIFRYDGSSGAFIDIFASGGNLDEPAGIAFSPDGYLYVSNQADDNVIRLDATTGAYVDEFVAGGSGGLDGGTSVVFMPAHQVEILRNTAPVITSDGGGDTFDTAIAENTTAVTDVDASDADGHAISYSISGGLDSALFSIDSVSGVLSFVTAQDFEAPADSDTDNVYQVVVTATDIYGKNDSQTINVTVTDVGEAPVIGGADTGAVTEDVGVVGSNLSFSGNLTISDPDAGESSFQAAAIAGSYGSLTIDAAGNWTYTANNSQAAIQTLDNGESIIDTLTVTTFDGTTHDILITINGAEDAAVISGDIAGAATEDAGVAASGTLTISDVDTSDSPFFPDVAVTAGDNGYGDFEMTGGNWTYTLDDTDPAVQALANGEMVTDTFTFMASDGSSQIVTITITGTNDAPVVTPGVVTGAITEGGTLNQTGSIAFTDLDLTDTPTATEATQSITTGLTLTPAQQAALENAFTISPDPANTNNGTIDWDYTIADADLDFLAAGDTITAVFRITVDDGNGGSDFQDVTITITGSNDVPVITPVDVTGAITEGGTVSESGSITFTDADPSDLPTATEATQSVTTTVALSAAQQTALEDAFTISPDPANTNDGTINWDYTIADSDLDFLANGETVTLVFRITVDDGNGGTATQDVTITVTGTNDTPVVTPGVVTGAITEGGTLNETGSITFTDLDLTDTPTATEATQSITTALTLTPAQQTALEDAFTISPDPANTNDGTINWDYTIADSDLDFLAAGETVTLVFRITVDDGNGSTATQDVTITVTGTNDTPVITAVDVVGAITEGGTLNETGSITFTDLDLTDTPTATEATQSITTALTLTPAQQTALEDAFTISPDPANTNDGTINWDYTIADSDLDFLANGETVTLVFRITVDDGNGGTATQDVTITVTGTNDTPVVTPGVVTGAITEGGTLNQNGSIAFTDLDLTDTPTATEATQSVTTTVALSAAQQTALEDAFTISPDPANTNDGTINWDYTIADSDLDFLATGETVTLVFRITVDDGNGGTATQDVTITVTGSNDVPVITPGVVTGAITEGGPVSQTGSIAFTDLDLTDTPTATEATQSVTTTVALSAAQQTALEDAFTISPDPANTNDGTINWDYTIADSDLDFLANGETVTLVFRITVDDGNGGTATQDVTIMVTGTNDTPVITPVDVTGNISEGGTLNETGSITFTDLDLTDTPTATEATQSVTTTVALSPAQQATLENAFTINPDPANTNNGTIDWDYTIADSDLDFLANGETVTLVFRITVDDANGGSATQDVTITITGSNDAPIITAVDVTGAITEGGTVSENGSITFTDLDLTDTPTATEATQSITTALSLTPAQQAALENAFTISPDPANTNNGTIDWDYTIADSDLDFLANGDTITMVFRITVDDGNGGTATQDVTITITGSNDIPVITPVDVAGTINEGGTVSESGSITFTDADPSDLPTATEATQSVTTTVALTPAQQAVLENAFTISPDPANTNNGTIDWDYTIADSDLDFLANGETVTLVFRITLDDGNGGTATQDVTITVTGTNDTPVITPVDVTGAIVEGGTVSENGSITFTDLDLTDTPTATEATQSVTTTVALTAAQQAALENAFTTSPDPANTNNGTIDWDYTIADSDLDFLAVGETVTLVFRITLDDGNGGTATQDVTITVTGSNDAPVITAVDVTGAITEGGTVSESGSITFTDLDLSDAPTASEATQSITTALALTPAQQAAIENAFTISPDPANINNGTIDWDYTIANADLDFLANGDTITAVFRITVDDGNGGSSTQDVVINIAGSNDAPVIGGTASGSVSEDVGVSGGNIVATGSLTISDPDAGESSFVAATVNGLYGNLVIDAAGNWRYTADNGLAEIQALVGGETIVDRLTVTTADGSTHDIVITIIGNDDDSSTTSSGTGGTSTSGYIPAEDDIPTVGLPDTPELVSVGGFETPLFEEIESAPQDRGTEPELGLAGLDASDSAPASVEDVQYASVDDDDRNDREKPSAVERPSVEPPLDVDNLSLQVSDDEAVNERFEQALLKHLDRMHFGIDGENGYRSADDIKVQILMGATATLTAGIVSWVLRGGSLLASLMSTVPLLNRFDPLPILKNREDREDVEPDDDDTEITGPVGEQHRRVDEMFSGKQDQ